MGPLANQTASLYMPSVLRVFFFLSDLTISQLTNVQSTKSEAAVNVRKKSVSCFTPTCVNTVDACL